MIKGNDPAHPSKPYVWQRHTFAGARWTRNRLVRSFLIIVPWIDLMAVALFLGFILRDTLVQPGRLVELPSTPATEGLLAQAPTAVVRRVIAPNRPNVSMLIIDDVRYTSDRPVELEALSHLTLQTDLNLLIDQRLPYGEALAWVERLRACGARTINLVTHPHPSSSSAADHAQKPQY